jgi:hypothetical protein
VNSLSAWDGRGAKRRKQMFNDTDLIYAYTRKDAIADGVLIDVSDLAKEAGFKWPVAVTAAVWSDYVRVPEGLDWQDENGRLWDILILLLVTIRRTIDEPTLLRFQVHVHTSKATTELVTLKAHAGPDDEGKPCLTIMRPEEN